PTGPTRVTELAGGRLHELEIHPEDFGLCPCPASALAGGDARQNAAATLAILSGEEHPAQGAVILNAAATLAVVRELDDASAWRDAAREARETIQSGAAKRTLERWRATATRAAAEHQSSA